MEVACGITGSSARPNGARLPYVHMQAYANDTIPHSIALYAMISFTVVHFALRASCAQDIAESAIHRRRHRHSTQKRKRRKDDPIFVKNQTLHTRASHKACQAANESFFEQPSSQCEADLNDVLLGSKQAVSRALLHRGCINI